MKMELFGARVLVKPPAAEKTGIEGFEKAQGSQDRPETGEVIAVGDEVKNAKVGDLVSFRRYGADEIMLNDEHLWIIKEEEVNGRIVNG